MSYKYSKACLFFALLAFIIGLILGVSISAEWFARFGAIIVFLAVASEYALVQIEMSNLYETVKDKSSKWSDDGWGDIESSKSHKMYSKITHITVGFGTIIWGFGDLLL